MHAETEILIRNNLNEGKKTEGNCRKVKTKMEVENTDLKLKHDFGN